MKESFVTNETTKHLAIAVDIYLTTPKDQSGIAGRRSRLWSG
jgi:hypothetical protein